MFRYLVDYTIRMMKSQRGDIGQMFTPPKSKSPWTAMTAGSSGGWADWAEPLGPLITAGLNLVPGVGPLLSAGMGAIGGMGKGSGYQGSDFGSANWGSTIGGGLGGYMGGGGLLGGGLSAAAGYGSGDWGDKNSVSKPSWSNQSFLGGVGSGLLSTAKGYMGGKADQAAGNWLNSNMGGAGGLGGILSKSGSNNFLSGGIDKMLGGIGNMFGGGGAKAGANAAGAGAVGNAGKAGYGTGPMMNPNGAGFINPPSTDASQMSAIQGAMGGGAGSSISTGALNSSINAAGAGIPEGTDWGTRMLNFFKQPENLMGIASMAGSMGGENPQYQSPGLNGTLTSALLGGQGMSGLDAESRARLSQVQGGEGRWGYEGASDEYFAAATRRIDEAYGQAEKDLVKRFKHYGGEESSDFNNALKDLRQDQAREKSAIGTEMEEKKWSDAQNRSYDAIKSGLQVGDSDMKNLLGLSGMAIEEAALMYGAEVADIQSLREAMGLGGATMLQLGADQNLISQMFGSF